MSGARGAGVLRGTALRTVAPAIGLVVAALALSSAAGTAAQDPAAPSETVRIDASAASRPFPHFWERMFGSGRAILSLRDSYRRDLRKVKQATGVEYVRFHAILDDEVGVYGEDAQGAAVYNFSYVDQIYDGLLEAGVRPFVELSFMPTKLAAPPVVVHPFWYKPIVSPPRDPNRWADLVSHFAAHLVDRYGIDEVSRWYFEVWNEPNIDFWAGNPKEQTYDQLYDVTAAALKKVDPRLRVGGPATAAASWIRSFLGHTVDKQVPIDFVSTHVYGNDSPQQVLGTDQPVAETEMVGRAVRRVHDEVEASPRRGLPIIWSEYNASYKNEPAVTDAPFMAPWLANTIRQCDGLADMLSYWTFSDVFEEQGVVKRPFYGGFGLIAEDGIPKPSFNAFQVLHRLGDRRIPNDSASALVTRRGDGALVVAAWSLLPHDQRGQPKTIRLVVDGLPGARQATVWRVDAEHGSPLAAYDRMNRPAFPTRDQIEALRRAAELPAPEVHALTDATVTLTLPAQALAVVQIK